MDCKVEWIVDKLIPKRSIILCHGKGGIGKTWLCLILADAIDKGVPFMGLATKTTTVVFVDLENPLPMLVERVRKIGIEDVLFWHNANDILAPPKLDTPLWERYKSLPTGSLIIFDTLRASQSRDENNSQDMAVIMQKLKDLRDAGFTILLLHHTPKGNDRTYKGSTAILDLADHVLSLHKVKKNNLEEIADDEDGDCLYRFGTKDKTRYEPFHLFLSFDPEKGFVKAADPDDDDMEAIREILTARGSMNQKLLFETVKAALDMHGKGKVVNLLRKGEGKFWRSFKDGRAVCYEAIASVQDTESIESDTRTHAEEVSR
jgi:archaellum biogenesis ATPase FlaH